MAPNFELLCASHTIIVLAYVDDVGFESRCHVSSRDRNSEFTAVHNARWRACEMRMPQTCHHCPIVAAEEHECAPQNCRKPIFTSSNSDCDIGTERSIVHGLSVVRAACYASSVTHVLSYQHGTGCLTIVPSGQNSILYVQYHSISLPS